LVLGPVRISYNDLTVLIVALVVAIGLRLLLYRTRLGVTMRATVDDRTLTALNGSSSVANARAAWVIGCMLAALAGILVAPTLTLSATALTLLIVSAYAASVIGRLRSIPMTFVGALILGLAVSYSVAYLPQNPYVQGFGGAVPAVVLFIALLALPQSRLRGHRLLRSRELALRPSWPGTAIFGVCVVAGTVMLATVVSSSDLFSLNRVWGLGIIGLSLIPLVGFAGRLSLCQMTFAGIGASVVAHVGAQGNPLALLAAAGVCAVIGVIVAIPALRLSGIYFALATAAFAITMDNWVFVLPAFNLVGHSYAPFGSGSLTFVPFNIGSLSLTSKTSQFIAGAVAFAVLTALVVAVRRSEFGQRLLAMKDSPAACATLGMNGRASLVGVFAFSAALAGVGGGIYGMALGSAAPDVFQFFGGLSVLLVMVIMGITSFGAAGVGGLYQGSPLFTNLIPSLTQLPLVLVGLGGVGVGTTPNGTIPGSIRPVWLSVASRRWLLGLIVVVVGAAWALRLTGAIGNWTMTAILLIDLALLPVPAYVVDYRARIAPPAFGLPERRSKEKRDAWFAVAAADESPVSTGDHLASLTGAGGSGGA
jgi:branched-chain amino acid transport system permease protein